MSSKKLNLNKYAYLDFLKGDIFAWLTCNDNFQIAAKEDKELRNLTPWRYSDPEEELENAEDNENDHERYGKDAPTPDQIIAGLRVGEFSERWARIKFPNHKIYKVRDFKNEQNIEFTKELLNKKEDLIIFEATFGYKEFITRTDILVKTGNKVKVIEVKATSSPKEVHAYDLFFQREIIRRSDDKYFDWEYSLLILNKEYIHDASLNKSEIGKDKISEKVFINIDYVTNGTLGARTIDKETKTKVKWSASTNIHYFNRLDNTREFPAFIEESGRTKVFTFPISDFFESSKAEDLSELFDHDLLRIKEIQLMDEPPKLEFENRNNKFLKSDYFTWALDKSGAYDVPEDEHSIFDLRGFNFVDKTKLMKEGKLSLERVNVSDISPSPFNNDKYNFSITDGLVKDFKKTEPLSKMIPKYSKIIQKHFYGTNDPLIHEKGIERELSKYLKAPIYMFDFETANLAIPFADGTSPYEQVVYQYSIHVITDPNDFDFETMKNIVHYDWLAETKETFHTDVWTSFTEVFKKHGKGIYVAWNYSFEKGCINRAQTYLLDDEAKDIMNEISEECVDLMDTFSKKYYYHRDLKGSYSIKYAGPHFANEINYKDLNNVQKGDQSAAVAKKWLRDDSPKSNQEWNDLRHDMLKYCMYDTLLMVAIFQRMKERLI